MSPFSKKYFRSKKGNWISFDWLEKAKDKKLKKCGNCKKWVSFIVSFKDEKRIKICPECKQERQFDLAIAEFKTENGILFRKDKQGIFKEIRIEDICG